MHLYTIIYNCLLLSVSYESYLVYDAWKDQINATWDANLFTTNQPPPTAYVQRHCYPFIYSELKKNPKFGPFTVHLCPSCSSFHPQTLNLLPHTSLKSMLEGPHNCYPSHLVYKAYWTPQTQKTCDTPAALPILGEGNCFVAYIERISNQHTVL